MVAERGNLLKISLNMLAKPGFSLHSLTQIDLRLFLQIFNALCVFSLRPLRLNANFECIGFYHKNQKNKHFMPNF